MKFDQDMTYKEIANVTKLSPQRVHIIIHTIYEKIRYYTQNKKHKIRRITDFEKAFILKNWHLGIDKIAEELNKYRLYKIDTANIIFHYYNHG